MKSIKAMTATLPGLPSFLFLLTFFVAPLVLIFDLSISGWTIKIYTSIVSSALYRLVLLNTFEISAMATGITLVLAYPYAFAMATASARIFTLLLACLLVPFWVSILLRTFAWIVLLQDSGLVNSALIKLGMVDTTLPLIRNRFSIVVGMVHVLLPYAVLCIYSVMRKFDMKLLDAAAILGARPFFAFRTTFLPLSLPGVLQAAIICFTLSLGFYTTPTLLGGSRDITISRSIGTAIQSGTNLPLASGLAVLLMLSACVVVSGLFALKWLAAKAQPEGASR
ncbi:ABC transporter permease [Sinorhizobium meliloti]|uniref:ABC transporter permease n=1 Tax=Rhizobium meliloti TaxID=382 RepID=UPI0009B7B69A|nr:ABC transporter permease [Sinorhizobium meliloti]